MCPWCYESYCVRGRIHDDGQEYRCLWCGMGHTRKEGSDEAFVFFPGDIYALEDPTIKPLLRWE